VRKRKQLKAMPVNLIIEAECSACGRVRSRRGALECNLQDRAKFVCAECVARFDDSERVLDEVVRMMDENFGGAGAA
jgi:hypothetical protein